MRIYTLKFIYLLLIAYLICESGFCIVLTPTDESEKFKTILEIVLKATDGDRVDSFLKSEKDPVKRTFWKYFIAINEKYPKNEELLNKLLEEEPAAIFPDEKFLSLIPRRSEQIFIFPNQKMKPSIYFEIAEIEFNRLMSKQTEWWESSAGSEKFKENFLKMENLYEKIIEMPPEEFAGDFKNREKMVTMACAYLLELYNLDFNKKMVQVCDLAGRIISSPLCKEDEFIITKWGEGGCIQQEALLAEACSCSVAEEEKFELLIKVLKDDKHLRWGVHGGPQGNYVNNVFYIMENFLNRSNFLNRVYKEKGLMDKYGYRIYVRLGAAALKNKDRKKAKEYFSKAMKFRYPVTKESELVAMGANGNFEWYDKFETFPYHDFTYEGAQSCLNQFSSLKKRYLNENKNIK